MTAENVVGAENGEEVSEYRIRSGFEEASPVELRILMLCVRAHTSVVGSRRNTVAIMTVGEGSALFVDAIVQHWLESGCALTRCRVMCFETIRCTAIVDT